MNLKEILQFAETVFFINQTAAVLSSMKTRELLVTSEEIYKAGTGEKKTINKSLIGPYRYLSVSLHWKRVYVSYCDSAVAWEDDSRSRSPHGR